MDLYGGDYYVDSESRKNVKAENNALAQDANWKNEKLKVGDVVYRNYDGFVTQEGVFGQVEFNRNALATFIAGSVSNTMYWRYDRFYYDKAHAKSGKADFWSGTRSKEVPIIIWMNTTMYLPISVLFQKLLSSNMPCS